MKPDSFVIPCADRVAKLPPYIFATVYGWKEAAMATGLEVFDLGVGNPDGRPAANVIEALVGALDDNSWNCHRYSNFRGLPRFREAISEWYFNRFGVRIDSDTETLPLIGSKEGLANLMRAYLNPGDTIIIPSPCYPAYFGAARLCEANIHELELRQDEGFVPDLERIPAQITDRARMLILNYPNNPTGGVCSSEFYEEAVRWCREHEVLLVSDIAYSELGFDQDKRPGSVLQVEGAMEIAVELGLDREEFSAGMASPAVKEQLKANTEKAIERGAFGVPTFFVREEMFWGQDRLDFVRREVERVLSKSK